MQRTMKHFAHAALFIALLATTPAMADDQPTLATLDISAEVNVKAAPDIATVSAGVVTTALTAEAAMKENAVKMTAVFSALKKAGIADKDIQTAGINISPQYNYPPNAAPQVTNYQATNTVNVTLRNMQSIGNILDALVSQGANQINGPTFGIEDADALLDKARAEAVKKARHRADIYATAAEVKIQRIVNISEQSQFNAPQPYPMMRAMAMDKSAESTPTAPGEVSLSVTVNVKYQIGQ